MSVLVVGSVALDTVETPKERREELLGGSATHFSVAASKFGEVQLVGVVGEDFPESGIELFQQNDIDITGLQKVAGKTFRWSGRYMDDMNQRETLSTDLNVFESFSPKIPDAYSSAKYLFLANIHPALQLDVLSQVENPKLVATDTMELWIDTAREDLQEVIEQSDMLVINDQEVQMLTGAPSLFTGSKALLDMGPEFVVAKKGEHGAMVIGEDLVFMVPGYPLADVVDPTGAGDSFAGGVMGYLAQVDDISQENLRKAVVYGSVLASYNVEDFSVEKLRHLSSGDIDERYTQFREITSF
ncbi:MAG: sugar kinase [Candidatus Marinimicrobia bacterium]|nr:sugar kinase [Candidatus Neomarinimicrobiota bacterium]MCF7827369.1 sugar kinase [Candidatus Neomarinimicrobiota bacterium]MCF7881398.1 sugar kinase [Candidatus Neomarinimicrobiota bacterium]